MKSQKVDKPDGKSGEPTRESDSAAVWVPIERIKPWKKNPRKNDRAIRPVADSIRKFGFGSPIVARQENGEIIAGHTRHKAAKLLGLPKVPVRFLDVDERTAHMMALADNKLGERADWDTQAVAGFLSDVSFSEALLLGWSGKELGAIASSILGDVSSDEGGDGSPVLGNGLRYQVLVECDNEDTQSELVEKLEGEGYKCKPMVS